MLWYADIFKIKAKSSKMVLKFTSSMGIYHRGVPYKGLTGTSKAKITNFYFQRPLAKPGQVL